ncbi:MAG: hypothetical protein ACK4YQ_03995 [Phenylobacterium sp.]|uniref:hypothetical protein n=1 Tax=Phenylobacterium sp. TaxID=1871053 RepID=UPI00391B8DDD
MRYSLVHINNQPFLREPRRELLRAAAADGAQVTHIACRDGEVTVTDLASGDGRVVSIPQLRALARGLCGERTLVLTGLGGARSELAWRATACFPRTTRVYDVYDELSYGARGYSYLKFMVRDGIWRALCPRAMVMVDGMMRIYPGAWKVENASHLEPTPRPGGTPPAVYIGSIDERVDFDLLAALGERTDIDIWGAVHERAPWAHAVLERLVASRPRVRFLGGYRNEALGEILSRYEVGLVPYHLNERMTRHVALDKLYHYLNAGVGVVTTPLPHAVRLKDYVGLLNGAGGYEAAAAEALARRAGWRADEHHWRARWAHIKTLIG